MCQWDNRIESHSTAHPYTRNDKEFSNVFESHDHKRSHNKQIQILSSDSIPFMVIKSQPNELSIICGKKKYAHTHKPLTKEIDRRKKEQRRE